MIDILKLYARACRGVVENNVLHLKYIILKSVVSNKFHRFRCNICGKTSHSPLADIKDREAPSCYHCGSTKRYRAIMAALTVELFGEAVALPDIMESMHLVGLGMSDASVYSVPLCKKLSYINTFYHREPKLDILDIGKDMINSVDFIISSDIFEHVPPPVDDAFRNLYKLLKKNGVCIFSVPYVRNGMTHEHYPQLFNYSIVEKKGKKVLLNKTRDGEIQQFENLVFHGGPGATLEMRLFDESALLDEIKKAGFTRIKVHSDNIPENGIFIDDDDTSRIISFRKE